MLRLPPFEWRPASSLAEAARILAGEGSTTRLVAGGTDLWPNLKRRHQKAGTVLGLMGIAELRGIRDAGPERELRIGAITTLSEVAASPIVRERYPALARAVASISSPPLRNMGTLGGNLCLDTRCTYYNQTEPWRRSIDYCMKEEGTVCWVAPSSPRCWAHSASDSAPILGALGARVRLVSGEGERTIAVADLFRDDGIDYLGKTSEEILAEVLIPAEAASPKLRTAFWKLRRRGSIDFAVLSVAVALLLDAENRVAQARIVLGSVASQPLSVPDAEEELTGRRISEDVIAQAARCARKAATPMDNTDFQAQWRGHMVERYTSAALREAAGLEPRLRTPRHRLL